MARPGMMIYFEIRKPLSWLPNAEKGQLFDAILEYGETGAEPAFEGMLAMAWSFIQPKLDRDQTEYDKTVLKRQYANWCRKLKKRGLPDVLFDDWLLLTEEQREHMISHDTTWVHMHAHAPTCTPTTTTTAAATTTATPTPTTTATATATATAAATELDEAAADEQKLEILWGKLGKGVIKLSPYQIDYLLQNMGVDMFDHYVERLADYIIRNDAKVKNHFQTITKWYAEDCGV